MAPGKATTPSFTEFATANNLTVRGKCATCALPDEVRAELYNAWAAGYRAVAMRRYLVAIGHEHITTSMLQNHFERGHHEGVL